MAKKIQPILFILSKARWKLHGCQKSNILANRALDLATRETDATLTNQLQAEIQRYQAHSPTRSKSD